MNPMIHIEPLGDKIIRLEITIQVVNMSTTKERQETDINVTNMQFQSLGNKLLFGEILALKSYFIDDIVSLKDQIKAYIINDNVQEFST